MNWMADGSQTWISAFSFSIRISCKFLWVLSPKEKD